MLREILEVFQFIGAVLGVVMFILMVVGKLRRQKRSR